MRISNLCNQLLWFWKRFSSFQMFSSMSASVDASPWVCWTIRELSDALVTFSLRSSCRCNETWEWETGKGEEKKKRWGVCSGFCLADPSAVATSPNWVSFAINHHCYLGLSQHFNAMQMFSCLYYICLVLLYVLCFSPQPSIFLRPRTRLGSPWCSLWQHTVEILSSCWSWTPMLLYITHTGFSLVYLTINSCWLPYKWFHI